LEINQPLAASANPADTACKPCSLVLSQLPREQAAAVLRGFILLTVVLMVRFQSPPPPESLDWVCIFGAVYILATYFASRLRLPAERLAVFFSIADIGLITALIYSTGGVNSEYYLLYYLPIIGAAMRLDFRDAVGAAVLAATFYLLVAAMQLSEGEVSSHLASRTITFSISSILLAAFFAQLSRESRAYQQLSNWYKQANDEKTEFVSEASHELRAPLTAILGFSDLLVSRDFDPDKQQEYLQTIKSQSERLARLIENILELSRLETGRVKLKLAPVKLDNLVANTLKELQINHGNVQVAIPANLPPAQADSRRLGQILHAVVENALRFSNDQPVEIAAAVEKAMAGGAMTLRLEVKDHGIGIPEEDLPHIFEMFYCASNNGEYKGAASNLAIAKRLLKLHKGDILAESTPGEGATFKIILPVWQEIEGMIRE
jgi:signal transduction histidine kinase